MDLRGKVGLLRLLLEIFFLIKSKKGWEFSSQSLHDKLASDVFLNFSRIFAKEKYNKCQPT